MNQSWPPVKNETVANLSVLPDHLIDLIDAGLKGKVMVPAGEAVAIARSVPHGHVAAVHAMARKVGLPGLLGPACPQRDLALALIISRVVAPASSRSAHAQANASYQHDPAGQSYRSFRGLIEHLATLTRNQVRFAGASATVPMLADPTSAH